MTKIKQLLTVYVPMLKYELSTKEMEGAVLDIYDTGYTQAINDMRKYVSLQSKQHAVCKTNEHLKEQKGLE